MRARSHGVLIAVMILAACAPKPPIASGLDRRIVATLVAKAAAQVQRCYRRPTVPGQGRQISTVLRVRYAIDGVLAGLPEVIEQRGVTPDNQLYAPRMAEAAIRAVITCSPLSLPPEQYPGGWDEFELTFSPRAVA